jgi:transcriptional regulator with PAS, ATPase and Fis domain
VTRPKTVGADPAFKASLALALRVAPERSQALIVGPTGSGKSHFARVIHAAGAFPADPFIEWHAGGVPESLLESELLGMHRGAATGVAGRPGIFEAAGRGTLCLVGIELLRPHQQAILLRILENSAFERVGGGASIQTRARLLACFSEPPEKLVASGQLRPDLFYRLDVIRVELPPLCDRPDDVPLLADHFLKAASRKLRRPPPALAPPLVEALRAHPWPGNVRELAQRVEGLLLSGHDPLTAEDLPPSFWLPGVPLETALTRRLTLEELRDAYMRSVLAKVGGNRTRAARWLGISRKALWDHLRRRRERV